MDFLNELEAMANTITLDTEVLPSDIERWQKPFGYTAGEAQIHIEAYRGDPSKTLVSDSHWHLVKRIKEAHGHDRESYSYSLQLNRSPRPPKQKSPGNVNSSYILKLDGPLTSPEQIQKLANLTHLPAISLGEGETSNATFCTITSTTRDLLLQWLDTDHPRYTPIIIHLSKSRKELSSLSLVPFLGCETTLPHQRANTHAFEPRPRQYEYPVYYFFYGRLLEPELLKRQLILPSDPVYRRARIRGAKMRSWQEKYKAVVDAEEGDVVKGAAFLVQSSEEEDGLRFFETDAYEVVRCLIEMGGIGGGGGEGEDGEGKEVAGLVFRSCGGSGELI